jgi:hypothetical protein
MFFRVVGVATAVPLESTENGISSTVAAAGIAFCASGAFAGW